MAPLIFSNRIVNAMSWATDAPGGSSRACDVYRAALRPLRWVLEGLRERISDETDATGERRVGRGCRKRACASSGRPRAPPTAIGCSAIWPAGLYVLPSDAHTLGHPKAATGHPEH